MSFDTATLYLYATKVAGKLGAKHENIGKQENIHANK
jgi:hypothetical protein